MKQPLRTAYFALSILVATSLISYAQTGTIRGRVLDDAGRPLQGATVQVEGTALGTATGSGGEYALDEIPAGEQTLVVRFVGYTTRRRQVTVEENEELELDFVLAEDLLGMGEVVVSGTFNPATKLESSTAITTLDPQHIEDRIPRGTADLLRAVPGMQVTSNYGEAGADVTVRGLPRTANSSFRYISLQEDGLPAFEPPGLLFSFPDAFVRQDETVARVEAVRGGSAPVFTSNTPGGIVNFISKTGGPELAGIIKTSAGTHGMGRLDVNVGGPLAENWRFNAGGYYRYDEGVRDPGYPANRGGQVKLNVTRDFDWGYARFYGKYLNEKNVWFMGIPFQNYKDPERIPGGPELGSGTTFSPNRKVLTIPDAFNPGSTTEKRMEDGFSVDYKMAGLEVLNDLGDGWNLTLRTRYILSDNNMNLMADVADPFPISEFGQPSLPAGVPRIVRFVESGDLVTDQTEVASLNGNGLMTVHGLAFSEQDVANYIGSAQISKQMGDHSISAGGYFSSYSVDWKLVQAGVFMEVANRPRLIQIAIPGPGGNLIGLTRADGFAGYNTSFWNLESYTDLAAFYIGDKWAATDRLHIDAGLRLDLNYSNGRNERPVQPGRDTGGIVLGQMVPRGYEPFVPTEEQTENGMFGSGLYREWDYSFKNIGGSIGLNYRLSEEFALYARVSSGNRAPTVQQWTFQTTNGSQITGNTVRGEVESITQVETGVKAQGPDWSLLLTGFYSRSKDLITNLHRGQPNGSFAFIPITGNTRTIGTEVEAIGRPLNGLELRLTALLQDPRFTRFAYDFYIFGNNEYSGMQSRDYSGNVLNDIARVLADFNVSYTYDRFNIFGNYRYTGERMANRPNTITLPAYGVLMGGVSAKFDRIRIGVRGTNLLNTQAINLMASRTGEDVLRVNDDGTAEVLISSGSGIQTGTTTSTFYTTGQGIMPRSILISASYSF